MKSSLLLMGMDIILKSFLGIDFVKKVRAFEKRFLLSSADLVALEEYQEAWVVTVHHINLGWASKSINYLALLLFYYIFDQKLNKAA